MTHIECAAALVPHSDAPLMSNAEAKQHDGR